MVNKGFVWNEEWINSYISNWCIFERFKFANALSNNDILLIFGNDKVKAVKLVSHVGEYLRSLISLDGIDENQTSDILGENLKSRNLFISRLLSPILGTDNLMYNITKDDIYYCPICIKNGFHSIFHQITLFKTCVFHPTETLKKSCENCGEAFNKYLLTKSSNPPFTCKCGYYFLVNKNVKSIFKSWMDNFPIKDKKLLELLNIYKNQNELPIMLHPTMRISQINKDSQSSTDLLIDFTKNLYLNVELDVNMILKEDVNKNTLRSRNALKKIINSYKNTFSYRFDGFRSLKDKDIIDAIYYDIYIQSRYIYKAIKRYLKKEYLKKHLKCIYLNNELREHKTYCRFSMAYTYWREEFEDIKLSNKVRQPPDETPFYNFESYRERFTLYPKGVYGFYLEDFLDSFLKKMNHDFEQIDISLLKKIVNSLLPYLLLERFTEYLDLTTNPSNYKSNNYNLLRNIPMHLIVINEQTQNNSIYYQNVYLKLKEIISNVQEIPNVCRFDNNKKYEPYLTPTQLAILKMDGNNYQKTIVIPEHFY